MPFETRWYVENRVILTYITGELTTDELRVINERSIQMIEESHQSNDAPPLVHHFMNIEKMTGFPRSLGEVSGAVSFASPRMGWLILVGKVSPVVRFFGGVVTQVSKIRFRIIETMPEAVAFLEEVDSTLAGSMSGKTLPDAGD